MSTARLVLAREDDWDDYNVAVVDAGDNLVARIYTSVDDLQSFAAQINTAFPNTVEMPTEQTSLLEVFWRSPAAMEHGFVGYAQGPRVSCIWVGPLLFSWLNKEAMREQSY